MLKVKNPNRVAADTGTEYRWNAYPCGCSVVENIINNKKILMLNFH